MTSERFKHEVDRLDSGLPEHPDTSTYMREGRAVRRRRHGVVALGAGVLVAATVVPAAMWGGGTSSGPDNDVTAVSDEPVREASPTPLAPVDATYGDRVTAAVTESFSGARFSEKTIGDHYEKFDLGVEPALSTPPLWDDVFTWSQVYAIDGLQYFSTQSYWEPSSFAGMQWCSAASYQIQKDCTVTESDGYTVVVHDGVRLRGEPDGDWMRSVQVVAPTSERGRTQITDVSAQVEGMTWGEADATLPTVAELTALATDERLRLPEPAEMPPTP